MLTGVATNVCVKTTARGAFVRDHYFTLVSDGTATYSAEEQGATLRTIDRYFGRVVSMAEVIEVWD